MEGPLGDGMPARAAASATTPTSAPRRDGDGDDRWTPHALHDLRRRPRGRDHDVPRACSWPPPRTWSACSAAGLAQHRHAPQGRARERRACCERYELLGRRSQDDLLLRELFSPSFVVWLAEHPLRAVLRVPRRHAGRLRRAPARGRGPPRLAARRDGRDRRAASRARCEQAAGARAAGLTRRLEYVQPRGGERPRSASTRSPASRTWRPSRSWPRARRRRSGSGSRSPAASRWPARAQRRGRAGATGRASPRCSRRSR